MWVKKDKQEGTTYLLEEGLLACPVPGVVPQHPRLHLTRRLSFSLLLLSLGCSFLLVLLVELPHSWMMSLQMTSGRSSSWAIRLEEVTEG